MDSTVFFIHKKKNENQSQGISAWSGPEYKDNKEPDCRLCGHEMLWCRIDDSHSEYQCQNPKCTLYFKNQEASKSKETAKVSDATEHARQLLREKIMELNR